MVYEYVAHALIELNVNVQPSLLPTVCCPRFTRVQQASHTSVITVHVWVFLLVFMCRAVCDHLVQGVVSIIYRLLLPKGSVHSIRSLYVCLHALYKCVYVFACVRGMHASVHG